MDFIVSFSTCAKGERGCAPCSPPASRRSWCRDGEVRAAQAMVRIGPRTAGHDLNTPAALLAGFEHGVAAVKGNGDCPPSDAARHWRSLQIAEPWGWKMM